jgi:hypothetical protein
MAKRKIGERILIIIRRFYVGKNEQQRLRTGELAGMSEIQVNPDGPFRVIHSYSGRRGRDGITIHILDNERQGDPYRYSVIAFRSDLSKGARGNGGSSIEAALSFVQWSALD